MMTKDNKPLIFGAIGCVLLVLIVQFGFISPNWADAAANQQTADEARAKWDEHFKRGADMMPKPEALKLLADNKKLLDENLRTLTQIELGTVKTSLATYTEAAAGAGDKKNYLDTKRKNILGKYSTRPKMGGGATDLGLTDKAIDDPVGMNLIRLFVADSLLGACVKAEVDSVTVLKAKPLSIIDFSEKEKEILSPESDDDKKPARPGATKTEAAPSNSPGRMVQFPMEATLSLPEKQVSKLLFELEKPSDGGRGYLAIRGFHVFVKDPKSGMVEVTILASGLLDEKVVGDLGIEVKGKAGGRGSSPRSGEIRDY